MNMKLGSECTILEFEISDLEQCQVIARSSGAMGVNR